MIDIGVAETPQGRRISVRLDHHLLTPEDFANLYYAVTSFAEFGPEEFRIKKTRKRKTKEGT